MSTPDDRVGFVPTPSDISPLSVLVVEDQSDIADSTAELLAIHGCEVRVARCGPEALRLTAVRTPDVVLLDIAMPGMNGWDVARAMRHNTVGKQPFVVAVTGYGSDGARWQSMDAGVDLHLLKPVDPTALMNLLDRVRRILSRS